MRGVGAAVPTGARLTVIIDDEEETTWRRKKISKRSRVTAHKQSSVRGFDAVPSLQVSREKRALTWSFDTWGDAVSLVRRRFAKRATLPNSPSYINRSLVKMQVSSNDFFVFLTFDHLEKLVAT